MAKEKINRNNKKSSTIISFILTLIAAGVAFYFGWVQFELPENTYAVLFSKTNGYDENVIKPGTFNWKWQRLLPSNSKLIKVKIELQSISPQFNGQLPSSKLYSEIIPNDANFSYNLSSNLSYFIDYKKLPHLVESNNLDPLKLDSFYSRIEAEFTKSIKDISLKYFTENFSFSISSFGELESTIKEKLEGKYDFISIRTFSINTIQFPDIQLYHKAKGFYLDLFEKQKELELSSEKWELESKINLQSKLEILSIYGDLLTKYPVLIDYFALEKESQVLDLTDLSTLENEISEF